nr:CYP360A10 protein [Diaphanosoma celebensis]
MESDLSIVTSCIALVASALLFLLYKRGTSTFGYFRRSRNPGPKPIPFIGNMWGIWKKNFVQNDAALVAEFGKIFGVFDGQQPNLIVSDPEIIRSVLVEDFECFTNKRKYDMPFKFFRKMILHARDDEWKLIRTSISPAFRAERMTHIIKQKSLDLTERLVTIANDSGKFNCRDVFNHFAMEVIAECVFAKKIDCHDNENELFMKNAQTAFCPSACKSPAVLIPFVFPKLTTLLAKSMMAPKEFQYFLDILEQVIAARAQSDKRYDDFLEAATELVSKESEEVNGSRVPVWTKEEVDEIVIAQSCVFLTAGFETTVSTLSNICLLLARHPEVQDKLHQLTVDKIEEYGKVCHEMLADFPYVEQVVKEALRLYSPIPRLERQCNKAVSYDGIDIKEGVIVSVPVYALHYSEEYYPQPEKFDPDRWSPENKSKNNPYTFVPFGMGPRSCVGMKFAMDEIKLALCTLIAKLKFSPAKETPEKVEIENGFHWVIQTKKFALAVEARDK